MYGLNDGLTSVSSALGPTVITPLFAWSENNGWWLAIVYEFMTYSLVDVIASYMHHRVTQR